MEKKREYSPEVMQEMANFGALLEGRMYEKRMNVTDLHRDSNVDRVAIYRIFRGQGGNVASLFAVCKALDVSLLPTT